MLGLKGMERTIETTIMRSCTGLGFLGFRFRASGLEFRA